MDKCEKDSLPGSDNCEEDYLPYSDKCEKVVLPDSDKSVKNARFNISNVSDDVTNTNSITCNKSVSQRMETNTSVSKKYRHPSPSYPPPHLPPSVIIFV